MNRPRIRAVLLLIVVCTFAMCPRPTAAADNIFSRTFFVKDTAAGIDGEIEAPRYTFGTAYSPAETCPGNHKTMAQRTYGHCDMLIVLPMTITVEIDGQWKDVQINDTTITAFYSSHDYAGYTSSGTANERWNCHGYSMGTHVWMNDAVGVSRYLNDNYTQTSIYAEARLVVRNAGTTCDHSLKVTPLVSCQTQGFISTSQKDGESRVYTKEYSQEAPLQLAEGLTMYKPK